MGNMIQIKADKPIEAYFTIPDAPVKGAVLVVHEVWGLVEHTKVVADRFAEAGYVALAPDLLGQDVDTERLAELQIPLFDPAKRNAIQPELRRLTAPTHSPDFAKKTLTRLKACFDYLYNFPESHKKVAIVGFCFGGTYSFSLAVQEPKLNLAIPFYGHSDHSVKELKNIKCPVYAFYGEKDERLIAGLPNLDSRMKEAGVDFRYKVYPNCGHAFFNDTNPYAYNPTAAEDSWNRILKLLSKQ